MARWAYFRMVSHSFGWQYWIHCHRLYRSGYFGLDSKIGKKEHLTRHIRRRVLCGVSVLPQHYTCKKRPLRNRNGLIKLNQQLTYENDLLKSAGKRRYTFGTFIFFRGLKPFYQITTFNLTALGTREKLFYRDFSALNLSFFFFSNIQLQDTIGIFRFNFSLVGYFR